MNLSDIQYNMYKPTEEELKQFWNNPITEKFEPQIYERFFGNHATIEYFGNQEGVWRLKFDRYNQVILNIETQEDYLNLIKILPKTEGQKMEEQNLLINRYDRMT